MRGALRAKAKCRRRSTAQRTHDLSHVEQLTSPWYLGTSTWDHAHRAPKRQEETHSRAVLKGIAHKLCNNANGQKRHGPAVHSNSLTLCPPSLQPFPRLFALSLAPSLALFNSLSSTHTCMQLQLPAGNSYVQAVRGERRPQPKKSKRSLSWHRCGELRRSTWYIAVSNSVARGNDASHASTSCHKFIHTTPYPAELFTPRLTACFRSFQASPCARKLFAVPHSCRLCSLVYAESFAIALHAFAWQAKSRLLL